MTTPSTDPVSIPRHPSDIDPVWLNRALAPHLNHHRVITCHSDYSEIPGQTADVIDVRIGYDGDECPLPDRMIAKITSSHRVTRDIAIAFDMYRREVAFYREFKDLGIPAPKCFHCDYHPDGHQMVLLMEHLAPAESPSWAISPEQVEMAAGLLPAFHARWWGDTSLEQKDCLVTLASREFWWPLASGGAEAAGVLRHHVGEKCATTLETARLFRDRFDAVLEFLETRTRTLTHGDYFGKQLFFPTEAGGRIAVIDWQYPLVVPGPWDLIRLLAVCLETGLRVDVQGRYADRYLTGLKKAGIVNYPRDELEIDFKTGALISQTIMSCAVAGTDMRRVERECAALKLDWKDVFILRGEQVLAELDVPGFLQTL